MHMFRQCTILLLFIAIFTSCEDDHDKLSSNDLELFEVPEHFPMPSYPEDNEPDSLKWALGKKLFYDPVMSRDQTISCNSCHIQELAFSDGNVKSIGIDNRIGSRNASPLFNLSYHPYLTREGSVPTLEMQVLVPIQEHDEMDFNIVLIVDRLLQDQEYIDLSKRAFGKEPDAYIITRALANFERSLVSADSKYDKYLKGELNLTADEMAGYKLFNSEELACSECHSGIHFTNFDFTNNGLYQDYPDTGRYRFTKDSSDIATFKIPSLRNIAFTAPYMHDGSIVSLDDVIAHYASGGADHLNKNPLINGFEISDKEQEQLIKFLKTLSDYTFIEKSIFKKE